MQAPRLLCLGALLGIVAPAVAQVFPVLPYSRTYDVLVGERAGDSIARLRDLNQDGDYNDAGEAIAFFTNGAAGVTLSSLIGVTSAPNGTVYAVDLTSDQIVALRDLNGDGDADDAGEATVWFSAAGNASGVQLGSSQSLAVDVQGRLFVLTANNGSPLVGFDGVLKTEDLNFDGDAQDAGEASYFVTVPGATAAVGFSNPTEFVIGNDGAIYFGDIGTGVAKGIWRAADNDFDGDANDPGELTLWWVPPFSGAAWYGMTLDLAGNLYVTNHSPVAPVGRSIYRAFDTNASGAIDPAEQQYYYTAASGIWWDFVRTDDDSYLMIDAATGVKDVLRLKDLNADNDFLDAGEVTLAWDPSITGFATADVRCMAIMRAPQLAMTSPVAIGTPLSWLMQTAEPFDLGVAFAALSIVPPISLPPYGALEIDPGSLILFGLTVSNLAGQATYTLTLANDPSLIGSYAAQAWCGELSRMFLSNPAPFTIQ